MGLNEVYSHARSQILMMNPMPSVSKAYAMIVADESQRVTAGSRTGGDLNESMALYAGRGRGTHHSNESMALYADRGRGTHYSNESMAMNIGRGGYTNNGSRSNGGYYNPRQKKNWHLFCDYCKLHGHTKDICFKLIGYPADWKFKKKAGPGGSTGTGNAGRDIANHAYTDRDTRDEFGFMNHSSAYPRHSSVNNPSTSTSGGNFDNIDTEQHMANTAMASTASAHIADKKVHLPNGQSTLVAHTGNCRLPTGDVLTNVLVVPEFKFDLLSDLFNGKVKGTGKERGGLYYFSSHLSENVEQGLMAQTENSEDSQMKKLVINV
ncbi:hypothetical protein KY284_029190 [Solanum tuberosum]|nr:hypothetical protein KY284_029190 [Solanum tuberosum]